MCKYSCLMLILSAIEKVEDLDYHSSIYHSFALHPDFTLRGLN